MNKNTKIGLNYVVGGIISMLLLWSIFEQVSRQLHSLSSSAWQHTGAVGWLLASIALMFVNTSLEGLKWFLLARSVQPVTYARSFSSYLAGVTFSIITPNRIGEYPGRILYLGRSHTFRYINVSVLGVMSQLSAVYLFGLGGLIYYNIAFPALIARMALCACLVVNVLLAIVYWRFEAWLPLMQRVKWLRRFAVYGRLLKKVTSKEQIQVLGISLLRFGIFTAQYLFLLRWMSVDVPLPEGYCMAALFFWVLAVIPSVALTELGVRGSVGLYLFHHFSDNSIGVLAATFVIWLLNLMLPSIIGSILILRMKLLQ